MLITSAYTLIYIPTLIDEEPYFFYFLDLAQLFIIEDLRFIFMYVGLINKYFLAKTDAVLIILQSQEYLPHPHRTSDR